MAKLPLSGHWKHSVKRVRVVKTRTRLTGLEAVLESCKERSVSPLLTSLEAVLEACKEQAVRGLFQTSALLESFVFSTILSQPAPYTPRGCP